jgi:phospholipid/cholesterol/gamma-HCH transport system substrate-binding protein
LKISKELKTGVIAIAAIALFIMGINFLKGSSFFGGDENYFAYFPNSGQLAVASNVTLNGVIIGKVTGVEYVGGKNPDKQVRVRFNIQNSDVKLPKGSIVEIGSPDLFSKALILNMSYDLSKGYYEAGSEVPGSLADDMIAQVKTYADPIVQRVQAIMGTVDKMALSLSAFWDTTATSELQSSLKEVKTAIRRFGNVAAEVEMLVTDEKAKFGRIMSNVESITANLKKSNDQVTAIVGNVKKLSDDVVTSEFKSVVSNASNTLKTMNEILDQAKNGQGTLGKLLGDEKLYQELINTNQELQNLVNDLQLHPERYIHFSVLGAKTKGVPLTGKEEKKLRILLDSIPD